MSSSACDDILVWKVLQIQPDLSKGHVDVCQGAVRLWYITLPQQQPQLSTSEGCTVLRLAPGPGLLPLPATVRVIHHSQLCVHAQQLIAQGRQHCLHTHTHTCLAAFVCTYCQCQRRPVHLKHACLLTCERNIPGFVSAVCMSFALV